MTVTLESVHSTFDKFIQVVEMQSPQRRLVHPQPSPLRRLNSLESNSEDQQSCKYGSLPPLGLSKEQLLIRLQTLKDYPTYKQTKTKRINLSLISSAEQSPIINTALNYGHKEGRHQVLNDYLAAHHSQQNHLDSLNRFKQMFENSRIRRPRPKLLQQDPSFICYKSTYQREKLKIGKMVSSPQEIRKRIKTEPPRDSLCHRKSIPFPKELQKMKHKLQFLPVVAQSAKEQVHRYNPQIVQQLPTVSLYSDFAAEESISPQQIGIRSRFTNSNSGSPINKKDYLGCLRNILDKSSSLLSGDDSSPSASLNSSHISSSEVEHIYKGDADKQVQSKKLKRLRFWPAYPKYSISQFDNNKLSELVKISTSIPADNSSVSEPAKELDSIVRDQVIIQQQAMQKDLLQNEHSLGAKFSYLIQLEKGRVKKATKELTTIKREFYLQTRKQQIRANGIKRMKKLNDSSQKKTAALLVDEEKT